MGKERYMDIEREKQITAKKKEEVNEKIYWIYI
jgi:hypothetical protein